MEIMRLNILYVVAGVIGIIGSALCFISTLLSLIGILTKIGSFSLAYINVELLVYDLIMLILSIVSLKASNSLRVGGYAVRDNSIILIIMGAVMMFLKGGTGAFLVLLGGILGLIAYLISEIV
ncbi:MAG: hypothetical protein DRN04_09210 [Thermoprotei archaeon]|nr:MAG: hypothetical protein DRN04_09210 [Thermoprotei archaeon]